MKYATRSQAKYLLGEVSIVVVLIIIAVANYLIVSDAIKNLVK